MIQDWVETQSYMQRLMLYMNNLEFPTLIKRLKLRNIKRSNKNWLETLRNNNYISLDKAQQ